MSSRSGFFFSPLLAPSDPPVPHYHNGNVKDVKDDHGDAFPQSKTSISQKAHAEARCNNEEAHVSDEALFGNAKGPDQGHGAGDNGSNKAGCTNELSNGETAAVCAHCSKSREHIGAAIAKGQKGHASHALAHSQDCGNRAKIDAKEVTGSYADCTKEEAKPRREYYERDRLDVRKATVVQVQVGQETGLIVGAVFRDEGALVAGSVN